MLRPYLPQPCHEGTVKRRDFIHTVGAAAAGGMLARAPLGFAKRLDRIGLETYSCRHAMAQDPDRTLETAKLLGHEYLIVPDFEDWTKQTLDDWREWADRFNTAGAVARKAGIWLAFHNEPYHQKPIDGKVPLDVFIERRPHGHPAAARCGQHADRRR